MIVKDLYLLVENVYGYKVKMQYINSEKNEVGGVLYDSFFIKCDTNDEYGRFGAGICFGEQKYTITEFLGKRCSLNSDKESIKESLQIIDDYCRLRLPDKFLDAYYKAYVTSQYEDCDM